uniref:Anillin homology domain-containing protein n=1 Tax=Meloidogyne enterolobii TaxID=390850 RepID=A0A6V7X572_MELEN|nr:unnamed protein product [Meloidogyne enterolobii]
MDVKSSTIYNFPNSSSYNSQRLHSDDISNENETVSGNDIVIKQHMKKMVGGDFKAFSPITPVKACSPITSTPKSTRSSFRSSSTLRRQQGSRQRQDVIPEGAAITDVQELLQLIQAQRDLMDQAAAAIAFCKKKYSYSGNLQELISQRILLVSQERLIMFNRKLDELKDHRFLPNFTPQLDDIPESVDLETEDGTTEDFGGTASVNGGTASFACRHSPTYTLFIEKFVLHLNPSFSMKKIDKDFSYAFIILCRYSDYIHATQISSMLDIGELRNNKVKIRELIAFEELPADFCIMVEVFALRLGKRWDHKWQSVWDLAARTFRSIRRIFSSRGNNNDQVQSASKGVKGASFSASSVLMQPTAPISSDFQRCGYLHLNRDSLSLGKEKFYLIDADYPLEGSIEVCAHYTSRNMPVTDWPDTDRDIGAGGMAAFSGTNSPI